VASPLYYWDYLRLDSVLGAQELESARRGEAAHDEMLFVIVHQAFELWFKQILWELRAVDERMRQDEVPEQDMGRVVAGLTRITTIQRLLVDQLDVLETMTPLDFLDFRDQLMPASGFQSVQFRLIEIRLGLSPARRLKIKGQPYTSVLAPEHVELLDRAQQEPSLLDAVERWLERTPFLHIGDFDFWDAYRAAVTEQLQRDRQTIETLPNLDDEAREAQLAQFAETMETFEAVFDVGRYEALRAQGRRRLSHQAFRAALLITLYRDEPALQLPFRLLTALVDVDEGFTAWRYRHALLAHRMIGARIGTGGTSGHDYLEAAAKRHRVFTDLFDLPTFLLPRRALPKLPSKVTAQMHFRFEG
jgi:tryptophan 2,3-dioxygenase